MLHWKACLDSLTEAIITISPLYDPVLLLLQILCVGVTTLSFYDYVWIMIFLLLWQGPQGKSMGLGEGQAGILYVNYEYCISDETRSYGTPKDEWRKWSDWGLTKTRELHNFCNFFISDKQLTQVSPFGSASLYLQAKYSAWLRGSSSSYR